MTTLPAWAARLLRKELRFVADGMEFDREAAAKLLALLAPRRKNEKQRASAKRKAGAAQAAGARSAEIRKAVFRRYGPRCELGWHQVGIFEVVEMHHLKAGSAKRATESFANCLRACRPCHRRWHNEGPASFVPHVKQWAERWGYPLPSIIRKSEASAELPGRAAR